MSKGTHAAWRWRAGLLAPVALAAFALLWPESPYRASVGNIATAQAEFHRRGLAPDGAPRYGTLAELTAAGLLRPNDTAGAETAPAEDAPAERWWAAAGPPHPLTGRFYFADQSGVVRVSWEPIVPRLDRATGAPPAGLGVVGRP